MCFNVAVYLLCYGKYAFLPNEWIPETKNRDNVYGFWIRNCIAMQCCFVCCSSITLVCYMYPYPLCSPFQWLSLRSTERIIYFICFVGFCCSKHSSTLQILEVNWNLMIQLMKFDKNRDRNCLHAELVCLALFRIEAHWKSKLHNTSL